MVADHHVGYVDVVPGRTTQGSRVGFVYVQKSGDSRSGDGGVRRRSSRVRSLGKKEPWELWDEFGGNFLADQDLYFFSPLKMVSGKRTNRKIESDWTWSGATTKDIEDPEGNVLGQRGHFRYENEKDEGDGHHGQWLLEEYSLGGTLYDQQSNPKIVLCRLKKSPRPPTTRACVPLTNKRRNPNPNPQPSKKRARKEAQPQTKKAKIVADDDQEPHPHQSYSSCSMSSSVVCDDQQPHPSQLNNYSMDNPIMAIEIGSDPKGFTHDYQVTGFDLDDQECPLGLSLADLEELLLKPPLSEGERINYNIDAEADETQSYSPSGLDSSLVVLDSDTYSEVSGCGTATVVAVDNTWSSALERQEQPLSQEQQLPENQPSFALDNWSDDAFPTAGGYEDPNYMNSFLGVQLPLFGELPHTAALGADQYSPYQSLLSDDGKLLDNNLWQY